MNDGVLLISEERKRQIEKEGFDDSHDNEHDKGELALAAACYIIADVPEVEVSSVKLFFNMFWPWELKWFKPSNRRRNLIKAGALIAAELDRLIREEQGEQG